MPRSRPGLYDAIVPTLPPLPPEDPQRQDLIAQTKATVTDRAAFSLANEYVRLRAEKDAIKTQLAAVQLRLEAFEQLLIESQEARAPGWGQYGVKENALRLPTGDTVRVYKEPYGKVIDREAFRQWCLKNGYERQLQLHHSTMVTLIKERLVIGEPEPDGCEAYGKPSVEWGRAK